jgi:hypothetical protein
MAELSVEPLDESSGLCECCGTQTRCIWGFVHSGDRTVAAYWVQWTVGHLKEFGANVDLVIGRWGEGASADDRSVVALQHFHHPDGSPALMVIDAADRPAAQSDLARFPLRRADVIGSELATQVFAITDAIYLHDSRMF